MALSLDKIDNRLSSKREAHGEKYEALEALYEKIDAAIEKIDALEASELNEAEQAELAELAKAYKADEKAARKLAQESKALLAEIDDLEAQRRDRQNALNASPSQPQERVVTPAANEPKPDADASNDGSNRVSVLDLSPEQKDHDIASFMRNTYLARHNGIGIIGVCRGEAGDQFRNDRLVASIGTTGAASILPPNYLPRLIELLRSRVVIRSMPGLRTMQLLNGNLRIPRQSASSSAAYTAEHAYIVDSEPGTDQILLAAKKLTGLVVQSGELMRRADPSSDRMILDDMIDVIARVEDLTFLRSDGSGNSPKGLKKFIDDADTALGAGTRAIAANATVNLANVTTDIGKLILALTGADVPMRNPCFILHPRSERFLMDIRDGNGNWGFPEMRDGMLRAYPYKTTTQIPTNLGVGTDESEVYFVDASEFIVADAPTFEVNVSQDAAYHDGTNVRAAFSADEVVFRTIVEHDTAIRHQESAAMLTAVTWGA